MKINHAISLGALALTTVAVGALRMNSSATASPTTQNLADWGPKTNPNSASSPAERLQRGEHLVLTAGCQDCHTPLKMSANGPVPDTDRMLSGHPEGMPLPPPPAPSGPWLVSVTATNTAWSGPWGTSFTANLTPDDETGLGRWTLENFVRTMKTGKHWGQGRPILPPMPIPAYRNFSEEELADIFAYLKSLPAKRNRVPAPIAPAQGG